MELKKYRPITNSLRQLLLISSKYLNKKIKKNKLTFGLRKSGGRNSYGKITSFHRGGGHKRKYRLIDFKRKTIVGIVKNITYDPNRNCFISEIYTIKNNLIYILTPKNLKIGEKICSSPNLIKIYVGNSTKLKNIPVGSIIHNIELKPGKGGQLVRSAGMYSQLIYKNFLTNYAHIRLRSGNLYYILLDSKATLGILSNSNHKLKNFGKAGRMRWLNKRPVVRGVAMNPVDHPHGGGEGKTSGGRHPSTPWGRLTKGPKTRKKNKKTFLKKV
jgi:large subunit ribosomal protein L2